MHASLGLTTKYLSWHCTALKGEEREKQITKEDMPYLVSTVKKSCTVSKAAVGTFLGRGASASRNTGATKSTSEEATELIVSCVDRLLVYSNGPTSLTSPDQQPVTLLAEFSIFATILLMEAVPLVNPITGRTERHLLFVFTVKNQFALFGFTMEHDSVRIHKLFEGDVESSFYQPHYDGAMLSCVTTSDQLLGGAALPRGQVCKNAPMVAVTVFHKNVFLFDVACCLGRTGSRDDGKAKHKMKKLMSSLLSEDYLNHVVNPRKDRAPVTVQFLEEVTLHSIGFGYASGPATSKLPLYVLHSDIHSRSHVAEYTLQTDGVPSPNAPQPSDAIQLAILGLGFNSVVTDSPLGWIRSPQMLLRDLELEARQLIVLRQCVCIVGAQLVTTVDVSGPGKKPIVTHAIPQANKEPSEPRAGAVVDANNLFYIAYANGAILAFHMASEDELSQITGGVQNSEPSSIDVSIRVRPSCLSEATRTVPECIAPLSSRHLFIGSLLGDSVIVTLPAPSSSARDPHVLTVLENHGPIIDMTIVTEGARRSVVASNGVDQNGGMYLLRSAVNFDEEFSMPFLEGTSQVHVIGDLVCFSFPKASRFLRYSKSEDEGAAPGSLSLTEIEEGDSASLGLQFRDQTLLLSSIADHGVIQVTATGVRLMDSSLRLVNQFQFQQGAVDHVAWISTRSMVITSHRQTLSAYYTAAPSPHVATNVSLLEHEISCLAGSSDGWVVAGTWMDCNLVVRHLDRWSETESLVLPSVPRSVCIVDMANGVSSTTIVAGLMDGSIELISFNPKVTPSLVVLRIAQLSRQPVSLEFLPPSPHRSSPAILCCCDVPAIVYQDENHLSITGVALDDIEFAGGNQMSSLSSYANSARLPPLVVASRQNQSIAFGNIQSLQKISRTAATALQHKTVAHVVQLANFGVIAASIRSRDQDDIALFTSLKCFSNTAASSSLPLYSLLENERCNFITSMIIGGPNDRSSDDLDYQATFPTPTRAEWVQSQQQPASTSGATSTPAASSGGQSGGIHLCNGFNAILIGSSFIFNEETIPRTSRLIWGTVERGCDPVFVAFGEKDFTGTLTSICMVPHCPNRVAVGLNGSIALLKWNGTDRSFVGECSIATGNLVVSLTPHFPLDSIQMGLLVAADWKHSVTIVKVNPIDNGMELTARDGSLRGVMALQVVRPAKATISPIDNAPSAQGCEILFADEMMNLFAVNQEIVEVPVDGPKPNNTIADDEEEEAPANNAPPSATKWCAKKRLLTVAQSHIGDRITSLVLGDLSPCGSSNLEEGVRGSVNGCRFLYGTVHGALGTITPIASTPFRIYELIQRHTLDQLHNGVGGGFDYEGYSEVLALGHTKSQSNPSFHAPRSRKRNGDGTPSFQLSTADPKYVSRGVASVDIIRKFDNLTVAQQALVCEHVNASLAKDVIDGEHGFAKKRVAPKKKPTVLDELLPSAKSLEEEGPDEGEALAQPSETELEEANELLSSWKLPTMPLQVKDISALVTELVRAM